MPGVGGIHIGLGGGGGGGGLTLAAQGDLALNFDAQNAASLTLAGATLTSWANLADTAFLSAVTGSGSTKPQYSATAISSARPGLVFGTNRYAVGTYASSNAQPRTIFIVMQPSSYAATAIAADGLTATTRSVIGILPGQIGEIYGGSAAKDTAASALPAAGTAFLFEATFDGANSTIHIDGTLKASGTNIGTQAMDGITIGNRYALDAFWFPGAIGQVVMYRENLGAGARANVRAVINSAWGL